MPKKDELVLDPSKRDIQRLVTNEGCFVNDLDTSDRLNPIFEAACASGIGELRASEDTVSFLEAIINGTPGLMTTMHCGDELYDELYRGIGGIGEQIVYQAVQRSGMTSAMRMASLHADPDDKMILLESLEELEGLPDGRDANGKTHHERTD